MEFIPYLIMEWGYWLAFIPVFIMGLVAGAHVMPKQDPTLRAYKDRTAAYRERTVNTRWS